jgi:alpha-galactosidase
MTRIVIIGAGSGFGSKLSCDILALPELRDATIALCDIDEAKLKSVARYIERVIEHHNLPARVEASPDRRKLLPGADFVITSISVGGAAYHGYPSNVEVNIPKKYGVQQSVADTIGVGNLCSQTSIDCWAEIPAVAPCDVARVTEAMRGFARSPAA